MLELSLKPNLPLKTKDVDAFVAGNPNAIEAEPTLSFI
jgi:hypothetical protein